MSQPLWHLVDPELATGANQGTINRILTQVATCWEEGGDADGPSLDEPTLALLGRHRVSTLLPLHSLPRQDQAEYQTRLLTIYGVQLRVESVAVDVLEKLKAAGISSRVLKGLATAELDYPDRSYRQTGDVDLAILPNEIEAAANVLRGQGYRDFPGIHRSKYLRKGVTLLADNRIEVDLHGRMFQRSPSGPFLFDDRAVPLTDLPGFALAREQRLVHAAGHFILGPPGTRRLSGLIDVTMIRNSGQVDYDLARSFARAVGVEGPAGAALRLEAKITNRTGADPTVDWRRPDWLDERTLLRASRNLALEHFSRLRDVPRADRVRYLPQWLLPPRQERAKFRRAVRRDRS